jgi:mannose-6-phosphate isomerase-like protein (cupin superfamily)
MATCFTCPVDEILVASKWHERGFDCERKLDQPGTELIDYLHDVDELHVVIQGEMEITFGNTTLHPNPGEEVFVPAGTLHTVRNIGESDLHRLRGHFIPTDED